MEKTKIPNSIVIKRHDYNKMSDMQLEGLLSKINNVIIDDSDKPYSTKHVTKKEKALDILNKLDITTKEGQKTYDKWLGKAEEYLQKFDSKLEQLDKAFSNVGKGMGNINGGFDDPKKKKRDGMLDFDLDLGKDPIKF